MLCTSVALLKSPKNCLADVSSWTELLAWHMKGDNLPDRTGPARKGRAWGKDEVREGRKEKGRGVKQVDTQDKKRTDRSRYTVEGWEWEEDFRLHQVKFLHKENKMTGGESAAK